MTSYKKYLKSKGIMLDCDYPFLPIDKNGVCLLNVFTKVVNDGVMVFEQYVVGTGIQHFDRNGNIEFDFD